MESVLLLNADMTFHSFVNWRRAVCLAMTDVVNVLEEYDHEVRSVSFSIKLPAVLQLKRYVKRRPKVKLTRANLLARDNYKCQYCLCVLRLSTCTLDHVIPVVQGGKRVWENIVAACLDCNHRKAGRTPEQAKMKLAQVPFRPRESDAVNLTLAGKNIHELWRSYLYWNLELENDIED